MPRVDAMAIMRAEISPAGTRPMVRGSAMFSRQVSVSSRLEFWKTKPSSSRRKSAKARDFSFVTSCPLIKTVPEVGASMVAMQLSSVVLPEPDAPMMPTKSPFSADRLTPASARVEAPLPAYTFSRFRTSKTAAMAGLPSALPARCRAS